MTKRNQISYTQNSDGAMFIVSSMINSRKENEVTDAIAGLQQSDSKKYAKYGD